MYAEVLGPAHYLFCGEGMSAGSDSEGLHLHYITSDVLSWTGHGLTVIVNDFYTVISI